MAWNFEQIVAFAKEFNRPAGTELAFVFSEWTAEDGLTLVDTYPVVREDLPPTEDAPANQANRLWVKINNGAWQKVSAIPSVTNIGLGTAGAVVSGIESTMVIAGWNAKQIAAGYVLAPTATLDQINSDRTTGIALIRVSASADDETHALAPDEPFTAGQVTALAAWLNAHDITNAEFAALFDVTAAQLSNWLTNHARWRFAQQIHDRFG